MSYLHGVRSEILRLLESSYPDVVLPSRLEEYTTRYSSRIGELRREGWQIETVLEAEGNRAGYRLLTLVQGVADCTHAGCVIRHSAVEGWQVRTHQEALTGETVPDDVLQRAAEAALEACRQVVEPYLPVCGPDTYPDEVEDKDLSDFLSIFEEG